MPGLLLAFWVKRRSFFTWINDCSNNGSGGGLKLLVEKVHLRMSQPRGRWGREIERARTRNKNGGRGKGVGKKKKKERESC